MQKIYSKCFAQRRTVITSDSLLTITMQYFCHLYNDMMSTPLFAEQNCVERNISEITVTNHVNVLFVALLLNTTVSDSKRYMNESFMNQLPQIEIPKQMDSLNLSPDLS